MPPLSDTLPILGAILNVAAVVVLLRIAFHAGQLVSRVDTLVLRVDVVESDVKTLAEDFKQFREDACG